MTTASVLALSTVPLKLWSAPLDAWPAPDAEAEAY